MAAKLATASSLADVLPHLHQHAVESAGGRCSVLFEFNSRSGALHATSAFGVDDLQPDAWRPGVVDAVVVSNAFHDRTSTVVSDLPLQMPELSGRIPAPTAALIPLFNDNDRIGLLVIGFAGGASAALSSREDEFQETAGLFQLALELFRLRRREALQRDFRDLFDEITAPLATTLDIAAGLEVVCDRVNRLFGADRTSLWLHDRTSRQLSLQASTDAEPVSRGVCISAEDGRAPAAGAMRRPRAEILPAPEEDVTSVVTIPLRGTRRALGAIVLDGVRIETGGELEVLDRADEFGRQLSSAIENISLLRLAVRRRTEPEDRPSWMASPMQGGESPRHRFGQSEKLAALGQLVAGIAHELNNPLQAVLGHLELLRATGAIPKEIRRDVQTVYREADRAAKIVRNLLMFAGSRRVIQRPVSLNSVIKKVLALRQSACRALGIEVVRHYDDKLPRVQSDPLLLHQALLNMVMNAEHAIAATGGPGRMEVSTFLAPSGDRVVVTVRDTGRGIPPEALSRIFEPFYTTKEVGKGTGLGLAITYGIVQDHGGEVSAANHPEGGAIFTVELPIARAGTHSS